MLSSSTFKKSLTLPWWTALIHRNPRNRTPRERYPMSLYRALLPLLFLLTSGILTPLSRAQAIDTGPQDINGDLVPDLMEMSPHYLSWGPNTSGPFFTGTAEVEPVGSYFYEPYWFDYLQPGLGFSSLSMPQRLSVGLVKNWEFDVSVPLVSNSGTFPTTPAGTQITAFGIGDTLVWLKQQLTNDEDPFHFWARPALTLEYQFTLPTGHYLNLNPQMYTVDQTGDGQFNEGLFLIMRKHFKPFMLYLEIGDIVENPTQVEAGFTLNDGITTTTQNQPVVNGNLLWFSGAFEHVINDEWGAGYVLEFFGESQVGQNLFFGAANTPPWSFLWVDPGLELTWPNLTKFSVTWGVGMAFPVYQSNYPTTYTPMGTITVYYNGPFGYRGQ